MVYFVVNTGLQRVDLASNLWSFLLPSDLRLVFVGKLVVDAVVEVKIIELLVFSVDFPDLLSEFDCPSVLQQ
jgi:hypothetical protein